MASRPHPSSGQGLDEAGFPQMLDVRLGPSGQGTAVRCSQVIKVDDSERTDRRQGATLTAGELVHAFSVDGQLSLLPVGKVQTARERVGVVEFAWTVRVPAGAAAPIPFEGR